ncbi:MAG: tape measure protein [Pseudomonadota bacterium]
MAGRLSLVTKTTKEARDAQAALFNVAQETRAPLEETVGLYVRLAQATAHMGLSQERQIGLTRTVNQLVALSGTTAASASAALIQFGQGLAAGQLRGEELNSVLEQTPALAKALADGLGVGIGQLREMAKQGALTPEVVIGALERMSAATEAAFAGMPQTVEQAMTQAKNVIIQTLGELNQGGQLSATIITFVRLTASSIEWLAGTLLRIVAKFSGDVARVVRGGAELFGNDGLANRASEFERQAARNFATGGLLKERGAAGLAAALGGTATGSAGVGTAGTSGAILARGRGGAGVPGVRGAVPGIVSTMGGGTFSGGLAGVNPSVVPDLTEQIAERAAAALAQLQPSIDRAGAAFTTLGESVSSAFAAMVDGSMSAADAFTATMAAALAQVSQQWAQFYALQAAGRAVLGDASGAVRAGAIATGLFGLSGLIRGSVNRAARGVGGVGGGAFGVVPTARGMVGIGDMEATVVIRGGLLDMSSPTQADALARALQTLSGRKVRVEVTA